MNVEGNTLYKCVYTALYTGLLACSSVLFSVRKQGQTGCSPAPVLPLRFVYMCV